MSFHRASPMSIGKLKAEKRERRAPAMAIPPNASRPQRLSKCLSPPPPGIASRPGRREVAVEVDCLGSRISPFRASAEAGGGRLGRRSPDAAQRRGRTTRGALPLTHIRQAGSRRAPMALPEGRPCPPNARRQAGRTARSSARERTRITSLSHRADWRGFPVKTKGSRMVKVADEAQEIRKTEWRKPHAVLIFFHMLAEGREGERATPVLLHAWLAQRQERENGAAEV